MSTLPTTAEPPCAALPFIDPGLARQFEHQGWIVTNFLAAGEAHRLHTFYAARDTLREPAREDLPSGFRASLFCADEADRLAVDACIKTAFAEPLKRLMHGHRALLGTFLEKRPMPEQGEVPLHQDWSFVDETRYRSLNVWCPLDDVDERNGCLWVLPGSHRFPTHPRAPFGPSPWIQQAPDLARRLVPVPLRRGQALIHDHRLWHASLANRSRTPRLAAACVVVPASAQALHFSHGGPFNPSGPLNFTRHEVDDAFFPAYRLGEPPCGRYPATTVQTAPVRVTPEVLAALASMVEAAA